MYNKLQSQVWWITCFEVGVSSLKILILKGQGCDTLKASIFAVIFHKISLITLYRLI